MHNIEEKETMNKGIEPQSRQTVRWTPEQEQVIRLRNRSMLVSAAAGSGKTAVLVERIISMVTDAEHPIDVDELLVVTFTNAAAAEMRERVLAAIERAVEANPSNVHLQRQMTLIHNAQITTIDSFCNYVLHNYFYKIGLEPGFRIADPGELTLLREDVCDAVLEEYYAKKDARFLQFVDSYSTAKSDAPIREMMLRLYDFSQSYPWPKEWLEECAGQYRIRGDKNFEDSIGIAHDDRYNFVQNLDVLEGFEDVLPDKQSVCEQSLGKTREDSEFWIAGEENAGTSETTDSCKFETPKCETENKRKALGQVLSREEDVPKNQMTEDTSESMQGLAELEKKPWAMDFLEYLHTRMEETVCRYEKIHELTLAPDGPQMYEGVIVDDLRQLKQLLFCEHLLDWQEALATIEFKRLPGARKYDGSVQKKEAVMSARNALKKQIADYRKKYFSTDMRKQVALLAKTAEMVEMLVELTNAFAERFRAEKTKKNMLDFSDVEHYALDILVDADTKKPTETAAEFRARFREIMIDEYQDSNYVQEALLTAVSGISEGRENLFMVGDVKQSIYRFRLARPELFMQKYDTFSTEENPRQRIDLHKNFRSRGEVVDVVNDIFARIMGRDLGNVEYDREAALYQGASFPESGDADCFRPECILVTDDPTGEDKKTAEARAVAQRIRRLVDGVEEKRYKDCVILLRSLSGWAETFQKVFEEEGIPLIVSSQTGYFSAPEVQTVLAMLRILDNPCQDIPLAAVMKSEIGKFTDAELAQIRIAGTGMPFFQCVQMLGTFDNKDMSNEKTRIAPFAQQIETKTVDSVESEEEQENFTSSLNRNSQEILDTRIDKKTDGYRINLNVLPPKLLAKVQTFWKMLTDFRKRIPFTPIHELLQQIYDETHFRDYVTALPAGEQRHANLDMLLEKAIAYEQTSYHGLFHFVRYIDRLMKYNVDYGEAEIIGEQENAVRLMTIHKSKGLEFPVVILAGMGKHFNMTDANSSMIFHPEYGVGLKWHNAARRTKTDTLIRQVFSIETKRENLGEELRILYVALTRAKEKLIMTGFYKDDEPEAESGLADYEKLPFSVRMDAACYWDWVLPALKTYGRRYEIGHCSFEKRLEEECTKQEALHAQKMRLERELADVDDAVYRRIDAQLSWNYPFEKSEILKQKVSVSEIKHRAMEEAGAAFEETAEQKMFPQEIPNPYIPKFVEEQEENRGALRGTAMHRFMECLDFASLPIGATIFVKEKQSDENISASSINDTIDRKSPLYENSLNQEEMGDGTIETDNTDIELKKTNSDADVDLSMQTKTENIKSQGWQFVKQMLQEISERMLADDRMKEADMELVNLYQIYQFLQTDAARRMCAAAKNGLLKKEQPFVMSIPANHVWPNVVSTEPVLVQGIIDVFWEESDGLVLLDYKTDHVDEPEELVQRYRAQLLLYAEAIERMFTPKKVKGILIYSFRLNRLIEI